MLRRLRKTVHSLQEEGGRLASTPALVSWPLVIFGRPDPKHGRSGRDAERFAQGHRPYHALRPYLLEEFEPKPGGGF